jgi:hypothetical protein
VIGTVWLWLAPLLTVICPEHVPEGCPEGFTRKLTTPGMRGVAVPDGFNNVSQFPQDEVCACTVYESVPPPEFETTSAR